jgi:RNase P protein component
MDRISKINQSMDLVLIARYITPDIDFETMNTELIDCLEKIFRDIKH